MGRSTLSENRHAQGQGRYPHPHPGPSFAPQRPPQPPSKWVGVAALIVAVVSLIGAIVPFINPIAWVGGVVGGGLAIWAFTHRTWGLAWPAMIISVLAIGLSIGVGIPR